MKVRYVLGAVFLAAPMLPAPMLPTPGIAGAAEPSADSDDRVVIADGHVDVGPRLIDDGWRVQIRDDNLDPPVWREPANVVLHAIDETRITVPESGFEFLGTPGAEVWVLPQAQQTGVLWPGWNTQDPSIIDAVTGPVTWTVHGVEGPGALILFLTGSFGAPEVLFDTTEPLPQQMSIEVGTHVHGNWSFTAPGIYHLDMEMAATDREGATVSDRQTLSFAIGDIDPESGFAAGTETTTTAPPETTAVPDTGEEATGSGTDDAAADATDAGTGPSMPVLIGSVVAVLGLVGAAVLLRRRRRGRREATP